MSAPVWLELLRRAQRIEACALELAATLADPDFALTSKEQISIRRALAIYEGRAREARLEAIAKWSASLEESRA